MKTHTPTPWFLNNDDIQPSIYAISAEDPTHQPCIALLDADKPYVFDGVEVQEANAEFIVRACNSHDALVKALLSSIAILDQLKDHNFDVSVELTEAHSALAAAGEV